MLSCSSSEDTKPLRATIPLTPMPAFHEDFSRLKLTSFDKLIERTCSSIKNVRLCSELDQKSGSFGVAPDAVEIQLKSPNWLFGQRKYDDSNSAPKLASHQFVNGGAHKERKDGLCELNLFCPVAESDEEDVFQRYLAMTTVNETNFWSGGTSLGDLDESNEIYEHYAELIQVPSGEPFQSDLEKEKYYTDLLGVNMVDCIEDTAVESEMEAAVKEYDQAGAELGIFPKSYKALAVDPSQLTRWIIGKERLLKL